tara:strand:- start:24 stop:212 length:189 start_codon:yes stop_codon:yes gene_type:complete
MKNRKIQVLALFMISSFYTFAQQGAYHDAMIEDKESGGQFPWFIGLIIIVGAIYFATKEKQN